MQRCLEQRGPHERSAQLCGRGAGDASVAWARDGVEAHRARAPDGPPSPAQLLVATGYVPCAGSSAHAADERHTDRRAEVVTLFFASMRALHYLFTIRSNHRPRLKTATKMYVQRSACACSQAQARYRQIRRASTWYCAPLHALAEASGPCGRGHIARGEVGNWPAFQHWLVPTGACLAALESEARAPAPPALPTALSMYSSSCAAALRSRVILCQAPPALCCLSGGMHAARYPLIAAPPPQPRGILRDTRCRLAR